LKKEEAQELLKKYRLGHCTKRERELLDHWYHSFDNDDIKVDLSDGNIINDLRKKIHEGVLEKIDHTEGNSRTLKYQAKPDRKMVFLNFQNLKRIAAVLIAGLGFYFFFSEKKEINVNEEETLVEEITPKAKSPSTIYLSDGSVVWLKGESRLEYPKSFTGATREVTLIGEAFFDVAKDREKPFIIHSAHFTTRVLGTSFNIKAYENDESQEVAVVTGKVVVSVKENSANKINEVVLKPSQKVIYSTRDNSFLGSPDEEDVSTYSSLAASKLAFNETSLGDIIMVLNAAHDANISLAKESMKNCVITADLTNENLETSIAILSKAINAEYAITEKGILLDGNGCSE
jgi:transmembrane sensor